MGKKNAETDLGKITYDFVDQPTKEKKKKKTSSSKKNTTKIVIVLIVLMIAAICIYKIIDYQKEKEEDRVALTLMDNLETEFGDIKKISDYIKQLNGILIEDKTIDTTTLGEQTITFDYTSQRGKPKTKSFNITIVDTTEPLIYTSSTLTVNKGYEGNLADLIFSGDYCDSEPIKTFEGEYDLNTEGSYPVTFRVADHSGNEATKDITLVVKKGTSSNSSAQVFPPRPKEYFDEVVKDYKRSDNAIGIDVSAWQGEIDYKAVKEAGCEFVYIRLGFQKDFGAGNELDEQFVRNIENAKANGLKVGIYFYSYATTIDEINEQTNFIVENLKDYEVDYPIAFDWESYSKYSSLNLSLYDMNKMALTFIRNLEAKGYKGALYSSLNYLNRIWNVNLYKNIWLALYSSTNDYDGDYYLWQFSNTGRIDGVSRRC